MGWVYSLSGEVTAWAAVVLMLVYVLLDRRQFKARRRALRRSRRWHAPRPGRIALWRGWTDSAGSMAVEFALLCPILVVLLMGVISYGSWLWLAQSMQGIASEAARAAIGGMDDAEREALARAEVAQLAQHLFQVSAADVDVDVETSAHQLRVVLRYDSTHHPLMQAATVLPRPPELVQGVATVRTGGY